MGKLYLIIGMALAIAACSKEEEKNDGDGNGNGNEQPVVKTEAPKVVSSVPSANATDVELLSEIVISYDKDIQLAPNTTVRLNGQYKDDGLYVVAKDLFIPVELEAGTAYKLEVLNPTVKDADGNYAPDFVLNFTTKTVNAFNAEAFDIAKAPADAAATAGAKALYGKLIGDFGTKTYTTINAGTDWSAAAASSADLAVFEYGDYTMDANAARYSDVTPITNWISKGGIAAVRWSWIVPSTDPTPEMPDPEMEGDDIFDFDDIATGNWEAYKYMDNSYFTKCSVGTVFTVYYKNAAAGAQMALKHNVEGWPGVVDANGTNYEYFDIPAGSGSYSLEVDAEVMKVLLGAGIIVGGHDYTIMGVSLTYPAQQGGEEYVDELLEFDDVVIGNWDNWKYLDAAALANCVVGTKMVIHYKDANGAQMGFRVNIENWPNLVDGNGREYGYFNIQDGEGDYTLKIDQTVLDAIKEPGIIIAGMNYTVCSVLLRHPVGGGNVEYEEEVLTFGDGIVTGNWADYKYLEPATFISCSVGSELVVAYKDAGEGAQMAFKTNVENWPGIVDENGNNYQYFAIAQGEGSYTLSVDATVLTQLRASGLIIGGYNYTILSLTMRNPKAAAAAPKKPVLRIEPLTSEFTADEALKEGTWQNEILKADLAQMAEYLKLIGDQSIIFQPTGIPFWNGSTEARIALWKYVFNYMTEAGLHNLIWEWAIAPYDKDASAYPGDAYVDVAAAWPDPSATTGGAYMDEWEMLLGATNHKVLALIATAGLPTEEVCLSTGCMWLWATDN